MKKILSAALAAAMLLSLTACNGGNSESGTSTGTSSDNSTVQSSDTNSTDSTSSTESSSDASSEPEKSEIDYSKLSEEEIYELMVERSLMTTGDMTRMANVLKKAEHGEEITVSYIGGPITEGLSGAPSHPETRALCAPCSRRKTISQWCCCSRSSKMVTPASRI